MARDHQQAFERHQAMSFHSPTMGLSVDFSEMTFGEDAVAALAPNGKRALAAMGALEQGEIANPDEGRMVGHYWLRAPDRAPDEAIREAIEGTLKEVQAFAAQIRDGEIRGAGGQPFTTVVVVGIGGSSLGPLLVCEAIGSPEGLDVFFIDNTDPEGVDRRIAQIDLATTLTVVISKSGGTKETRNGMLEMQHAYGAAGMSLGPHAVAITQEGSKLDGFAKEHGFVARFPMWDWVGGRTSVTSAVGLLPVALAGGDVSAFIEGARQMDDATRADTDNPALLLANAWYLAGEGMGSRNMVLLPYKDRLALTSRYLQQLVMESIGKRLNLAGDTVHQGLTVYGNKGSTDQHAYVQQLLDGPDDFFVTFIEVLTDRATDSIEVEPGVTSGDYLSGFLQGTRRALAERGRGSLTITVERLDAKAMGAIIALYERAVGLYASLVGINAYHQPGVESGKKAAAEVLAIQLDLSNKLSSESRTAAELAAQCDVADVVTVLNILRHLAANGRAVREGDGPPWTWAFKRA